MSEQMIAQIEPVEVVRDAEGWWSHPQYFSEPELEDVEYMTYEDHEKYVAARGIRTGFTFMENEDPEGYEIYCESGSADCSSWQVIPPTKDDGWFVLSIHDTEDFGPTCVWGRKVDPAGVQP